MWTYVPMCVLLQWRQKRASDPLEPEWPEVVSHWSLTLGSKLWSSRSSSTYITTGVSLQPSVYFLSVWACLFWKWTDEMCRPSWLASSTGHVFKGCLSVLYVFPCLRNIPFLHHRTCLVISRWTFGLLLGVFVWTWPSTRVGCLIRSGLAGSYGNSI